MEEERYYTAGKFQNEMSSSLPLVRPVDSPKYDALDKASYNIKVLIHQEIQKGILADGFSKCVCGKMPYVSVTRKNADDEYKWSAACYGCYNRSALAFTHDDLKLLWNAKMKEEEEKKSKEE